MVQKIGQANSYSNTYTYDAASNRKTAAFSADGSTNTYTYDTLNRLTNLTNSWSGQFGFSYDTLSRLQQMTRPNAVTSNYNYDSLSRLLAVLHQTSSATLDGATYTYDNAGNRLTKANSLNNVTETYGYDNIYQIQQVLQGTVATEQYTYDPVGNRLNTLTNSGWNYNSSNQLTARPGETYTYDNNGNTLSRTDPGGATTSFAWDAENRLKQVSSLGWTVGHVYDPFGRRIYKSSGLGTTIYIYDGANIVAELDQNAALAASYVQGLGIDQPLAQWQSGAVNFYEQDGLGSVTSLTNASGAVSGSNVYDAFGNTAQFGLANPFRYTGREFDADDGLYYYRARYYDPSTGRFLSEDPVGFFGGRNFYRYATNRPVQDTDPSGLDSIRTTGTGGSSYCMDTNLGSVCWGDKQEDLMRNALQQKNLCNCVHEFFGNGLNLNMSNLPQIDATHDLPANVIGQSRASDNSGHGPLVVRIDKGSFNNLSFDDTQLVHTYLHETANALAQRRFTDYDPEDRALLGPRGALPSWKQQHDPLLDPDIGNQFEYCLTEN